MSNSVKKVIYLTIIFGKVPKKTLTQAATLRRRAATQLSSGNPAPFFALVGISLASGSGVITKQAGYLSLPIMRCSYINQAFRKKTQDKRLQIITQEIFRPKNSSYRWLFSNSFLKSQKSMIKRKF